MGVAGAGGSAPLRAVVSAVAGALFFGGPVAMVALAVSARTAGYVDARDVVSARVRRFLVPAQEAANAEGVPVALVLAVACVESAGRPNARSPAGAVGLMQLMPETAAELAADGGEARPVLTDPATSLRLGARYLRRQRDGFASHAARDELALCAYNAGPGAVARWLDADPPPEDGRVLGRWIPYAETRAFVRRVGEWEGYWRTAAATSPGREPR